MSSPAPVRSGANRLWLSNGLARTAVVVLLATAVPVASLLWASGVARAEVEQRALAGLASTAKATVLQEQQAWDDAVRVITSAASRPVPLSAIQSRDVTLAGQGARNILGTGPFSAVRIFDSEGNLVALAALPNVTTTPTGGIGPGALTIGDPVGDATGNFRQVAVPIGAGRARLVVDVDLTQLLGKPSDLAFGRTGAKFLVTPAGLIVAGSTAVGTELRSAINRSIAATGKPVTKIVFSPFYSRDTVESYEPIPGQKLGILVQQARTEVMGAADDLSGRLRWAAVVVAVLGTILAGAFGVFLRRRGRRLAASERQLAASEGESRQRLEQFLDAIPIGVFVAGPDGRPEYANREAERLLGRGVVPGARADELAMVYGAYVAGTGEPYPAADMPLLRALSGETTHIDDMEIRRTDLTIPVEVWGTAVRRSDRSVEFGIAAFADVSERRRADDQVRFLSAITANMAEGVVLVGAEDSMIAYANGSFEAMFGYEAAELEGCSILGLTAPDFRAADTVSVIRVALRARGTWRGEIHGIRRDGTSLWCEVNVTALDDPTLGTAWIAVTTDITARRKALEGQARLASIVEASREAILGKTLDGVVTSWNHGAEMLFGYSAAEMIGGPIEVLIRPQDRDAEVRLRERVGSGLGGEQYDTVRIRKDGTPVDVSAALSPIEDSGGTIVGIAAIWRDVTERNRAQATLLEREEQLAAARDQALEASRLKSQFLANMSHEIRTPMNSVLGMTQLLLTGNLEPEQRGRVTRLHESSQGLLTIINDILDLSKMEAGKLELDETSFNLGAAVESVMSLCSSPANVKGLILTRHIAPEVPEWVRGDSLRLRQILLNIVGNAVKFTLHGAVDLAITWEISGKLRFSVSDTGIGLDPKAKIHLFEPFSQADASTTRRFGGTGLGLAISRQLVELMGGRLDFTSESGVGTTFWFEIDLPATEPSYPMASYSVISDGAADAADPAPIIGVRVLLVDDVEINREVGRELLKSIGYVVDTVSSGAEAVEAVQLRSYAAVLMDCLMPDMDGYETTSRIRDIDGPVRRIPIIALTAAAMRGDRDRCLEAGMDDYVSKPLDLDRLAAVLVRCVRSSPQSNDEVDRGSRSRTEEPGANAVGIDAALMDRMQDLRSKLSADVFHRVCEQFLSTSPDLIDRLDNAVRTGDTDLTLSVAHNLKGTTANIGAVRLSALVQRVESGETNDTVIEQIRQEYDRVGAIVASLMPADLGS